MGRTFLSALSSRRDIPVPSLFAFVVDPTCLVFQWRVHFQLSKAEAEAVRREGQECPCGKFGQTGMSAPPNAKCKTRNAKCKTGGGRPRRGVGSLLRAFHEPGVLAGLVGLLLLGGGAEAAGRAPRACSFDPGRTGRNSPYRSDRRGHGYGNGRGFFDWTFGAQSHGSATRCLRFAPARCRPARKTRFRPRGCALPGGACTHWVSQGKVSAMCQDHISFSFRELAWRNPGLFGVWAATETSRFIRLAFRRPHRFRT